MDSPSQQRIIVGVSGSLNSLVALQRAGAEAQLTGRRVVAVLAWRPRDTDSRPGTNRSTLKGTRTAALSLLRDTLDDVFGAIDTDIHIDGLAISGAPGRTLVQIANRESDLLVIGGGHRSRSRFGRWRSPVVRHCIAHATCPVLTVPPPPVQLDVEALTRKRRLLRASANDPLRALRRSLPHRPAYTDSDC
ncbi:universal stress protein [Streptomyces sp. NPDC050625]|uniref:universal stress protein n=1 Tax=Streptomyces sp. NPDC050625 TaxID=3154629 RepID=UPI003428CA55